MLGEGKENAKVEENQLLLCVQVVSGEGRLGAASPPATFFLIGEKNNFPLLWVARNFER